MTKKRKEKKREKYIDINKSTLDQFCKVVIVGPVEKRQCTVLLNPSRHHLIQQQNEGLARNLYLAS